MGLVDEHPSHKAWARELKQADEALAIFRKTEQETFAPYQQALAVWEHKVA